MIAIVSMYGLVGQYERVAYCGAKAGTGYSAVNAESACPYSRLLNP